MLKAIACAALFLRAVGTLSPSTSRTGSGSGAGSAPGGAAAGLGGASSVSIRPEPSRALMRASPCG